MQTDETEVDLNLRDMIGGILDLHGVRWRRYIASILKSHADAEDVVQEAVRRLLARNLSFYSNEQARKYLMRAINNVALELYNTKKREYRKRISNADCVFLPTNLPGPHEYMEGLERLERRERLTSQLRIALTRIPQKQLEALRLTVMERGSSIRDVGMNHGIPYSTLRHRSNQALRTLRRCMRISLMEAHRK